MIERGQAENLKVQDIKTGEITIELLEFTINDISDNIDNLANVVKNVTFDSFGRGE